MKNIVMIEKDCNNEKILKWLKNIVNENGNENENIQFHTLKVV